MQYINALFYLLWCIWSPIIFEFIYDLDGERAKERERDGAISILIRHS